MNNFQAVSGKNEPAPVTIAFAISLTLLFFILMVESFDRSMTCVEINQCVGCTAAVLAGTSGNRPQRHAIELASRRWRGGHDLVVAETRRDGLIDAQLAAVPSVTLAAAASSSALAIASITSTAAAAASTSAAPAAAAAAASTGAAPPPSGLLF